MKRVLVCCVLVAGLNLIYVHGNEQEHIAAQNQDHNETIDLDKVAQIVLPPSHETRVIGGHVTTNEKLGGYLMALFYENDFVCGGTLLHELIVLTAAHCFLGRMRSKDWIVVGSMSRLDQTGIRRPIKEFILADKFRETDMNMDVALMLLKTPMTGKNIGKLKLCTKDLKAGVKLNVAGWGMTVVKGRGPKTLLRTVTVPIINKKKCRAAYQPTANITDSMICAAVLGKKDACTFDSGGPMVYKKKQICGIVSFGIGCASKRYPGVYTDVFYMKPFIEQTMKVLLAKS
ncbi:seminase-like [Drosophila eugracilis]|uniref:seminase-like n=1 Tax=Drosophila eugracilis TaxID=29029 RepID=UPI0007E73ECB|nr:seminase-like [Drosophila eugracilis]